MHCNLRPPELRQSVSALTTTPCQVWIWTYSLPCYSVFAADTLLDLWPCNLDLWPLTSNICSASTVTWWNYQIWTQSSNPQRSYCDFSVWPYDFEHCVTCCARLWDNFHQVWPSTTYPCRNYSVFEADTLCHVVTLTFDPLTSKVRRGTLRVTCLK